MRDFHCSDAGMKCDFVAKGSTDDEVLKQAGAHAQKTHGMQITPDLEKTVRGLIHDDSSDAHQKSMSRSQSRP
jgi:predicted small metal-binding protein